MLQRTGGNGEREPQSCFLGGTQKISERKQLPSVLERVSNSCHLTPTQPSGSSRMEYLSELQRDRKVAAGGQTARLPQDLSLKS